MNKKSLDGLKDCVTTIEIENYFRNKKYANLGASKVLDNVIIVENSTKKAVNVNVDLTGTIGLSFRALVYLKFAGEVGVLPINSGEKIYCTKLHSLLKDLLFKKNDILTMRDITSTHLDNFIEKDLLKGNRYTTVYEKIYLLQEWILYANKKLPYILQIDDDLVNNSKKIANLKVISRNEKIESSLITNLKKPYSLKKIKTILSNAIQNIESYGNEIFEPAKYYMKSKRYYASKKYSTGFDFFKEINYKFKEPNLKEIQEEILNQEYKILKGGKATVIGGIRTKILNAINKIEASCIIVSLMLTGMRGSELVTLHRHPKFEKDEYINLKRIIYKTASTRDGEFIELPVPEIVEKAINILSELADLKDDKTNKHLILSSIDTEFIEIAGNSKLEYIIKIFCKNINIINPPKPHDFRHAMAFLTVHINEKNGLELARLLLGHKSVTMTLQYMAHFNNELKEAINELNHEESTYLVNSIEKQIRDNKFLFGENGKRLMPNHKFMGKQADEFIKFMRKGLIKLIEDNKLAIIQTPICLCLHDLSKPEQLACQQGLVISDLINNRPIPSKCKGANCSNSIFFEEHIEKLKKNMYENIDPELKARLEKNTYFLNAGGFNQDPYYKLIKKYDKKKGVI